MQERRPTEGKSDEDGPGPLPPILPKYPPLKPKTPATAPKLAQAKARPGLDLNPGIRPPGIKALYFFCIGLRSCIVAGTPILSAFHIMAESAPRRSLKKASHGVARDIDEGVTVEDAMRSRRRIFSRLFTNVFLAGLRAGSLPQSLDQLIEHYAWVMELRSSILRVVWYPIFLLFAGSLIMSAPPIFKHLQANSVDWIGAGEIAYGYFRLPLYGMAAAYIVTRILKSRPVRPFTDEVVARIPIVGKCFKRYALAIFFRVFAASVTAGREVETGFQAALDSMDNHNLARRLGRAKRFIRDGDSVTYALSRTRVLDRQALGMVEAGEISGSLPELTRKMAEYYMNETKAFLPGLIKAFFPLTLIIVAVAYFVPGAGLSAGFFGGSFLFFFFLFLTF